MKYILRDIEYIVLNRSKASRSKHRPAKPQSHGLTQFSQLAPPVQPED